LREKLPDRKVLRVKPVITQKAPVISETKAKMPVFPIRIPLRKSSAQVLTDKEAIRLKNCSNIVLLIPEPIPVARAMLHIYSRDYWEEIADQITLQVDRKWIKELLTVHATPLPTARLSPIEAYAISKRMYKFLKKLKKLGKTSQYYSKVFNPKSKFQDLDLSVDFMLKKFKGIEVREK